MPALGCLQPWISYHGIIIIVLATMAAKKI
jgi:hypothetical protein